MKRTEFGPAAAALAVASIGALSVGCSSVSYTEDFDRQVTVASSGTWSWEPATEAETRDLAAASPFLQARLEHAVKRELEGKGFSQRPASPTDYRVAIRALKPEVSSRPSTAPLSEYDVRQPGPPPEWVGFGVGFGNAYRVGSPYGFSLGFGFWPVFTYWNPYSWFLGARWGWGRPYFGVRSYGWAPFFGYGVYASGGHGRPAEIGTPTVRPGTLAIEVRDASSGDVVWEGRARGALSDLPSGDELDAHVDEVVRRVLEGFPPG